MSDGSPMPRRGGWPLWLAVKSALTSAVAIGAAIVLNRTLIPKAMFELRDAGAELSKWTAFVFEHHDRLTVIPWAALGVSVAAIGLRSRRPMLAILATVASTLALVVVVAALLLTLMPLYQM